MGTLIVVGVIVLVLVVFVGLVWLFVRLSRPAAAPPPTAVSPTSQTGANRPQRQNGGARKKRKKASGRKRR